MKERILAIDPGRKKCGIAISDEEKILARPLYTVSRQLLLDEIKKVLNEYKIDKIILGQVDIDDRNYNAIIKLAKKIERRFCINVIQYNESFSTMRAIKIKSKKFDEDAVAAAIILQDYLNEKK